MKVVILAGGFGTRLAEYTDVIPKPMVPVGDMPILWHIMKNYSEYNHKDFYLALGYKSDYVKNFFYNYNLLNSDFTIDMSNGDISILNKNKLDWKISLIDTGLQTMTGGRLKKLQKLIGNETFLLTYGDGLANIDINKLIDFHKNHGKMVTVSAVRPVARFGELKISEDNFVHSFQEKPQMGDGWINGGYFVIEPTFFELIEDDHSILEREPLEAVAKMGQLMAFPHSGFWQCMDTKRDKILLDELWESGNAPWLLKNNL